MTQHELSKAKDRDLIASVAAMQRAAALARRVAVQTGTAIVVIQDETIIRRTADELAAQLAATDPVEMRPSTSSGRAVSAPKPGNSAQGGLFGGNAEDGVDATPEGDA